MTQQTFHFCTLCVVLLLLFPMLAIAQVRTIEGKIVGEDINEGLPGVTVQFQPSGKGTSTDIDGNFKIEIDPSDKSFRVSFIGYKTLTVTIDTRNFYDLLLLPDVQSLDEVVVIGYGTIRKSDLTGSVSSIKSEDIVKIPASNPAQALQGKVAGVQVASASGAPGAQPVIRVRGVGTFGNSSPVFVVDGMILDDISFLTAADIESMEVLKDASAIAIYGSRGANGVILITTKKGKSGKATINVNTEYSMQMVPQPIALLDGRQFATIVNEISPGSFNNVDAVANTDWQSLIFNPAPIQNHQISASGKKDDISYFFSIGYFNQQGIIDKSNFERLTIRLNNEYKLSNKLKVGNNLTLAPSRQQNTSDGAVFQAYRAQPIVTPRNADGGFNEVPGVGNPLAAIEYTNSFGNSFRTVGNLFAELNVMEGLDVRSSIGVDLNNSESTNFLPVFFVSPAQQNDISRLFKGFGQFSTLLWENTVSYNKELGKSRINAVGGFTMQDTRSENFSIGAENILREDPNFWYINPNNINPNTVGNSVDFGQNYSMVSYLARVNYSFDYRYLATISYRLDGSSKFARGNRYAGFPAFALGWNIINESFMPDLGPISNLKLRASYGSTGNDRVPFDRIYSRVLNQIDGVFGENPEIQPGATYGVLGNPDLRWETTTQSDIGLEIGAFKDKLILEVDYFRRVTKDILVDLAVPGFLGNGQGARITYNAGSVLNEGFEFNLSYQNEYNGFKFRIGALGNTLRNQVLAISGIDGEGDELIGGFVFNRFVTRSTVGRPIGYYYGYQTDGIFQTQEELNSHPRQSAARVGDLRYVDINGDGVINLDDRTYLGSAIPRLVFGFNFSGSYKGFSLDVDFQGEYGKELYNAKETIRPDLYNFEAHVWDRWTDPGTSTTQPRPSAGGYNWQPSTRFVQDGSYLRLRNVTLGYAVPNTVAERFRMQSARIYLSGVNAFTLTRFTGYSPEFASPGVLDNGLDFGGYPVTSIYSLGLNLTF